MGVSGSGKTTIGGQLATLFDADFVDADDLHSAEAIAAMRAGRPLTDADRAPWLRRVRARLDDHVASGTALVVACSALKRAYRDILRRPEVCFVYLEVTPSELTARLHVRRGHFMPPSLLESQLHDLEPPGPDEQAITVAADRRTPDEVIAVVRAAMAGRVSPRDR